MQQHCSYFQRRSRPTPHGVGGLKSSVVIETEGVEMSHPTRGGWIEIEHQQHCIDAMKSHPTRGGWIEIGASHLML